VWKKTDANDIFFLPMGSVSPSLPKLKNQIDGRLLRTGAANISASGLKRQDNDLIVIESAEAASAFKRARC
jgi:hypothetical protein